jgi:hypothetical protein
MVTDRVSGGTPDGLGRRARSPAPLSKPANRAIILATSVCLGGKARRGAGAEDRLAPRAGRAEIEAEVRRWIDTVGRRARFVLSTSCELPPRANPDCVKWFMEALREYGRWDRFDAER